MLLLSEQKQVANCCGITFIYSSELQCYTYHFCVRSHDVPLTSTASIKITHFYESNFVTPNSH